MCASSEALPGPPRPRVDGSALCAHPVLSLLPSALTARLSNSKTSAFPNFNSPEVGRICRVLGSSGSSLAGFQDAAAMSKFLYELELGHGPWGLIANTHLFPVLSFCVLQRELAPSPVQRWLCS